MVDVRLLIKLSWSSFLLDIRSHRNVIKRGLTLYHKSLRLKTLKGSLLKNIVGKGENAGNQHFLLFPQCFLAIPKRFSVVKVDLFCHLQNNAFNLDTVKISLFGEELIHVQNSSAPISLRSPHSRNL